MEDSRPYLELESPKFGEFARQRFDVSSEDLAAALQVQQQHGGRLGAILVAAGLLTNTEVISVLREQARWVAAMRSRDLPAGLKFPVPTTLSLCLPCYNESGVIREVLDGACAVLPEFLEEFEIVVVDDGSSDDTAELVRQYSAEVDSRVCLVQREQNGGYGAAVTSGLRAAHGEWVCFTDGDGQFNFLDMPQLLVDAHSHDMVVGYRYNRADHVLRKFNAQGWKWVVRSLLGVNIKDLDCAFKLMPRRVIERLHLESEGACISAEIMAQCQRGGVTIAQRPVNHFPRSVGKATGANFQVIAKAFRELPTMWKYRQMKPWRFDNATPQPAQSTGAEGWRRLAKSEPDHTEATTVPLVAAVDQASVEQTTTSTATQAESR